MSSPNLESNSNQDREIFNKYKPLRNAIRKLCLVDSLEVIRAYEQNLQFQTEFPTDFEVNQEYVFAESKQQKLQWITEFHLETLCRELILHAQETEGGPDTLRKWNTLSRAINKLKALEELIAERFHNLDLIMQELYRTAHRQLPWQVSTVNTRTITRYFMVYKYTPLSRIIEHATGLSILKLLLIGMTFFGNFMTTTTFPYPQNSQIPGLNNADFNKFLLYFSKDLGALKTLLKSEVQMNANFAYAYHSLRAFPIIQMIYQQQKCLACPLPTLLFWRFTSGVYFEICNEQGFANAYGDAFQAYVGEVLKRGTAPGRTNIHPEKEFRIGKNLKRTVDWIMCQEDTALFIEVKTKRLLVRAKSEIGQQETLSLELDKLARMVVQIYKSIQDYEDGHYPNYPFIKERVIFPMVVTLEEWFVIGPQLRKEIDSKVSYYINQENIPLAYLQNMPYTVCSVRELEMAVQVMNEVGINKVMRGKVFDESRREWELLGHIRDAFPEHEKSSRFLFEEEFNSLNIESLTS